jgi:hypothetical protein
MTRLINHDIYIHAVLIFWVYLDRVRGWYN